MAATRPELRRACQRQTAVNVDIGPSGTCPRGRLCRSRRCHNRRSHSRSSVRSTARLGRRCRKCTSAVRHRHSPVRFQSTEACGLLDRRHSYSGCAASPRAATSPCRCHPLERVRLPSLVLADAAKSVTKSLDREVQRPPCWGRPSSFWPARRPPMSARWPPARSASPIASRSYGRCSASVSSHEGSGDGQSGRNRPQRQRLLLR
mmetsp:Transcript_79828/g.178592  ORF Transcript_79828/g.178592 Transcript_79828/m.178592 type:complete len:205 (+) Transcript_79828:134-748(+)